jgi:hypothetical protein
MQRNASMHATCESDPSVAHLTVHLGLVRLRRIAPRIVPANQSLYKLEKQSG